MGDSIWINLSAFIFLGLLMVGAIGLSMKFLAGGLASLVSVIAIDKLPKRGLPYTEIFKR